MAPLLGETLKLNTSLTLAGGAAFLQEATTAVIAGPGFDLGNDGGWSVTQGRYMLLYVMRRGIKQLYTGTLDTNAVGDVCPLYTYGIHDGGVHAQSDEGQGAAAHHILERDGWFHGTIQSSTGRGDRRPVLAYTSGSSRCTDGSFLLNLSKGTIAGNLNGPSVPLSLTTVAGSFQTFLNALPVTNPLPVSTAIGVGPKTGIPNPNTTRDAPKSITQTVQLALINGVYKAFTGGFVLVAGINRVEQSIITLATKPTPDGLQTVTFAVANPNSQYLLFQGGIAGTYISADANTMRSAYHACGSLDGVNLIYARMVAGGVANRLLPQAGAERWQTTGPDSGYHLYPGAEIVCHPDSRQPLLVQLEVSPTNWGAGDLVECPHWPNGGGTALLLNKVQHSPTDSGFGTTGISLLMSGLGISGGNSAGFRMVNGNGPSPYRGSGGPLDAPSAFVVNGTWSTYFALDNAPDTGPMFLVQSSVRDVNPIFSLNYGSGGNMRYTKSKSLWEVDGNFSASSLSSNSTVNSGGGASFLSGRVQVNGTNDYAEISFTGVFDQQTQRIRAYDGGFPGNFSMYFESMRNGGFVFQVPDSAGTLQPVAKVDAEGVHTPGVVEAAGFKSAGQPGWSGTYPAMDGRTVTVVGGIIVDCK